jgi:hypothetical protein
MFNEQRHHPTQPPSPFGYFAGMLRDVHPVTPRVRGRPLGSARASGQAITKNKPLSPVGVSGHEKVKDRPQPRYKPWPD